MNTKFQAPLRTSLGLLALLMAVILGTPTVAAEPDNRAVNWLSYREAMDTGRDQGKPILLHFTSSYSEICSKMKRETYQDRKVIRYLNAAFAVALVDIERLPALARKYQVESLPVIWFLDASGKPLTSIAGRVGPKKMLRVTEYIDKKIYEHTDYNTWLDKRSTR
jgi:thioredoxin-related protein